MVPINVEKDTLGTLHKKIAEKFGIDEQELAILYRHEPIMSGDVKIEFFNYDFREFKIEKKLKDMNTKLKHGAILFVEA